MNEVEDRLELVKIGGIELYKTYCQKIKEYLRENPGQVAVEIANGAGVPLLAVKRALREGVIEYSSDALDRGGSDKDKKRAQLIRDLRKAFDENGDKEADQRYHGSQLRRDLDVRGRLRDSKGNREDR